MGSVGCQLVQPRIIAAVRRQRGGGAPPSTDPTITVVDPDTITDRDAPGTINLTGTNLDTGTPDVADNEVGVGAIVCSNVSAGSSTDASFDYLVADGVTTIGTHTLTFTNDNGSVEFNIEVTDA